MSIADKITRLQTAKSGIASAILAKGGTVGASDGFEKFASDIASIPSGGAPIAVNEDSDVLFIDHEGTLLYGYSKEEMLSMTEMPPNPTHSGLTAQGWNWTLAEIKAHLNAGINQLTIGQIYITDDGKTRLYISIHNDLLLNLYLGLKISGTIVINWGDGSPTETVSGSNYAQVNTPHTYSILNHEYVITLAPSANTNFRFLGNEYRHSHLINCNDFAQLTNTNNRPWLSVVRKIELGTGIIDFPNLGLQDLYNVKSINFPNGVVAGGYFGDIDKLNSLKAIVFPRGITDNVLNSAGDYDALRPIYLSAPATYVQRRDFNHTLLRRFNFNLNYTSLISLMSSKLLAVRIPGTISKIPASCFGYMIRLTEVTIPSSITTISNKAFERNTHLNKVVFKSTTPPVLEGSAVFDFVSQKCYIYVPYSSDHSVLNAYKTATNYPSASNFIYMEESE